MGTTAARVEAFITRRAARLTAAFTSSVLSASPVLTQLACAARAPATAASTSLRVDTLTRATTSPVAGFVSMM